MRRRSAAPGPAGEGSTTGPTFKNRRRPDHQRFADSAAELLNLLVANMPQAPQLMADLTPDVCAWLVGQEQGFLEDLSRPPSACCHRRAFLAA